MDTGRRKFCLALVSTASASLIVTSPACSPQSPTASHEDPKLQACFNVFERILNIRTSSGIYGVSLDRSSHPLLQPSLPGAPILVPAKEIPDSLLAAIIATQDPDFLKESPHFVNRIMRTNERMLIGNDQNSPDLANRLARNLWGTYVNTLWLAEQKATPEEKERVLKQRVAEENVLAEALKRRFSKEQIARVFCNLPYLGKHRAQEIVGFPAASWAYFGEPLHTLSLSEIAHLGGILTYPSADRANDRLLSGGPGQRSVLTQMLKFRTTLLEQMEQQQIAPNDYQFACSLLQALDTRKLQEALNETRFIKVHTPPTTNDLLVDVLKTLRESPQHPLNQSSPPSAFTLIKTPIRPEAQLLMVEGLKKISQGYPQAAVTGLMINSNGDIISIATINGTGQHPYNVTLNGGGMLGPLREFIGLSTSPTPLSKYNPNNHKKNPFNLGDPDSEIDQLNANPELWGNLRKFLKDVVIRDGNLRPINLQEPPDLKDLQLTPAEVIRLYIPLIRKTSDIPEHLRLVDLFKGVHEDQSAVPTHPMLKTGIEMKAKKKMLELLGESNALNLTPEPTDGTIATLGFSLDHLCIVTVSFGEWTDARRDPLILKLVAEDLQNMPASLLKKLEIMLDQKTRGSLILGT